MSCLDNGVVTTIIDDFFYVRGYRRPGKHICLSSRGFSFILFFVNIIYPENIFVPYLLELLIYFKYSLWDVFNNMHLFCQVADIDFIFVKKLLYMSAMNTNNVSLCVSWIYTILLVLLLFMGWCFNLELQGNFEPSKSLSQLLNLKEYYQYIV